MKITQVVRPSAERPTLILTGDMFVRTFDGNEAKRIPRTVAEELVSSRRLGYSLAAADRFRYYAGSRRQPGHSTTWTVRRDPTIATGTVRGARK
jgi:hypothetical protein